MQNIDSGKKKKNDISIIREKHLKWLHIFYHGGQRGIAQYFSNVENKGLANQNPIPCQNML